MKRILIILLALTFTSGIHAKEWKENDRGLLIELTAGYGHATSYVPSESYVSISPGIGYQFNKRWAAGFRMTFETRDLPFIISTPFVRYSYLSRPRWALFAEAQGNIAFRNADGGQAGYYEAGIGLGGSFSITPHLKLTGRYLFVGYSSRDERERAYAGERNFLLDANVARLQIGLQVLF